MCSAEVRYKLCDWCEQVQDKDIIMKCNFTNSARTLRICDECYKLKPKLKLREDQIQDLKKQIMIDLIDCFRVMKKSLFKDRWCKYNIDVLCDDIEIHLNQLA
tara:strand:+ start:965 stop:1273 length:309 start_codon:yes stop_codon:yes gene_type:complete